MGHAIVAMALRGADPVQKVSIIPRGVGALGYTIQRPTEDRFLMGRGELKDRMAVLLAGRAAERLVFGEISTGAADDLAKATDIARSMVMRFGMGGEDLGEVAYEPERQSFLGTPELRPREYADATAARIDSAVRALISEASARAEAILARNRDLLDRTAQELLERETLDEAALRRVRELVRGEGRAPAAA
jgi:cell division protease FtsH